MAVTLASGCYSYSSSYVPPADGRARLVWDGKQAVADMPSASTACHDRVDALASSPYPALDQVAHAWWVSSDEGDPGTEDWGPGWNGGIYIHGGGGGGGGGHFAGGDGGGHFGGGHVGGGGVHAGGGGGGGGGGGHGGGLGGGDWGKGAIVIIVLAFLVIPTVTAVWSGDRPDAEGVARGMDAVHAYNDLVRSGDTACAVAP